MCTVSMIGDQWQRDFVPRYPDTITTTIPNIKIPAVSRQEFEALKREMEELKKLLLAAKEYDEKTGQPDCAVAEAVGARE